MMEDEYHEQMVEEGWAVPVPLPSRYGMKGPFMIGGNLLLYDDYEGQYFSARIEEYVGRPSGYIRRRIED